MSGVWAKWEGVVIDGVFPLRRFLGKSNHSVVFLTEFGGQSPSIAAVKLIPADPAAEEAQLSRWKVLAALSHPHLARIFASGRCRLGGHPFLFVVMEYAEQTLAQILPNRPLTSDEVREMLLPILEALAFLHGKSWVQSQLKPANILVVNDRLKLASDNARPVGDSMAGIAKPSAYDAPESRQSGASVAGDVWGLGVTMVEALTQSPPTWPDERRVTAFFPANVPPEFMNIARRCLSRGPANRPSITDLEAHIKRMPSAPAVSASAATESDVARGEAETRRSISNEYGLSATAVTEAAVSEAAAHEGAVSEVAAHEAAVSEAGAHESALSEVVAREASVSEPAAHESAVSEIAAHKAAASEATAREASVSAIAAHESAVSEVAAHGAALSKAGEAAAGRRAAANRVAATGAAATESGARAGDAQRPLLVPGIAAGSVAALAVVWGCWHLLSRSHAEPAVSKDPQLSLPQRASPQAPPQNPTQPTPTTTSTPAAMRTDVLHQVIPEVSHHARESIRGRIKVTVRVTVDRSGNVLGARLVNAGSSRYFARLATEAAGKWKFSAADKPAVREWLLRFEFTRAGTTGQVVAPST
jgi:TonB family protein